MSNQEQEDFTPPEITAEELDEYREWHTRFKDLEGTDPHESEQQTTAERFNLPTTVVMDIDGRDVVYQLRDLTKDVLTYFHILVTAATKEADKAMALFQSLLVPDDYDRLLADIAPLLHIVSRANYEDPTKPSVNDTWTALAEGVAVGIKAVMDDPKLQDWLAGRLPTGPSSESSLPPSGLPQLS